MRGSLGMRLHVSGALLLTVVEDGCGVGWMDVVEGGEGLGGCGGRRVTGEGSQVGLLDRGHRYRQGRQCAYFQTCPVGY